LDGLAGAGLDRNTAVAVELTALLKTMFSAAAVLLSSALGTSSSSDSGSGFKSAALTAEIALRNALSRITSATEDMLVAAKAPQHAGLLGVLGLHGGVSPQLVCLLPLLQVGSMALRS
jgi:hypothetical protein